MRRSLCCALIALAAMSGGCTHTAWTHRDFDALRPLIDSVAFVSPRIEYFEKIGRRKHIDEDSAAVVSRSVGSAVMQIVEERRLIRHSVSMTPVQYGDSIRISGGDEMKCVMTPALRSAMQNVHAKYFICVQGTAFTTPEKSKQNDLLQVISFHLFFEEPLTYEYQWNGLRLELALVDAATGDVLWYNRNAPDDSNYNPLDREQVESLCTKLCSGL